MRSLVESVDIDVLCAGGGTQSSHGQTRVATCHGLLEVRRAECSRRALTSGPRMFILQIAISRRLFGSILRPLVDLGGHLWLDPRTGERPEGVEQRAPGSVEADPLDHGEQCGAPQRAQDL